MSTILALETATDACSCALNIHGVITQKFTLAPQGHANLILPLIDALLAESGLALSAMDAIAFGQGPGSFMGVRIATGIAQGLGYAMDRPLIAVSTLAALAQAAYEKSQHPHILAGWDAKMGGIYWGAYQMGAEGFVNAFYGDQLSKPAEVNLPSEHQWLGAGNAWQIYQSELPQHLISHLLPLNTLIYPEAKAIAYLAADKYAKGEILSPDQAEPLYLRNEVAKKTGERT